MDLRFLFLCAALLAALGPGGPARAESANALARKGNEFYQHERYQEAADAYRQALTRDPTSPLLQYNFGTALARQGKYTDAQQALSRAAEAPGAAKQRDAYFNLGVSLGEAAQGQIKAPAAPSAPGSATTGPGTDNLQKKIELLEQSQGAFRQTILTDPKDDVAKYNYEVVEELLRQLRQQQAKQPKNQQQKDQQKQQNQQNKDQQQQDQSQQQQDQQKQQDKNNQQNQQNQQQQQQGQQDKQNQQSGDKGQQSKAEQNKGLEAQPTPVPTPQGQNQQAQPQTGEEGSGASGQQGQPLKPEQMDALRLLNLLEAEKPEQFKELFRFQGKRQERKLEKDW